MAYPDPAGQAVDMLTIHSVPGFLQRMLTGLVYAIALLSTISEDPQNKEFAGARSMAMGGAHRAVGSSNDTLILNPAGLASASRYSIDVAYNHGLANTPSHYHLSIVDSKSSAVAGGLGYTISRSDNTTQHRVYLGSAYQWGSMFSIGSTLKYVHGTYRDTAGTLITKDFFATDLGLLLKTSNYFSMAITMQNLARSHENPLSTYRMGFATSLYIGPVLATADVIARGFDFHKTDISYHGGIEFFVFRAFAVRAGYTGLWIPNEDNKDLQHRVSGGLGYIHEIGAIDVAYQQSVIGTLHQEFITTVKFFM